MLFSAGHLLPNERALVCTEWGQHLELTRVEDQGKEERARPKPGLERVVRNFAERYLQVPTDASLILLSTFPPTNFD